ncbi:cell morphogenesis protein PAG1 [Sodiomyces alkalinus F11]|uniref:Cell morphogenesis protein PAG1 n=1 Tax=Sodiomyces alkalinus (strain CBS 110278 / VKM F-3762 / F11) TaxID=1314773 RepID=A0A3N2Q4Z4_SODAK|nr:cell morphogenesis protein PAG1 [Sodiomyces alkalinus F11]ROT41832.1 cell morphogenesis protein PAG1 [Sodiomyces alkalinus F11]
MAPSQTLPDHLSDPLKFSPRSVTTLDEEDEEETFEADWDRTLRPGALDQPVPPSIRSVRSVAHSRESSLEKICGVSSISSNATANSSSSSLASPRGLGSQSRQPFSGVVIERVVDPKSVSYGHHRKTSIVHGIQHSRNGSLASASSSPLSPQMIAAAGAAFAADRPDIHAVARLEADTPASSRPSTSLSGATVVAGPGTNVSERAPLPLDSTPHSATQRRIERMHSMARREGAHHHTHSSKHHKDEQQKTVGEYALHVLFTQFIAQAEEKLNDCITVPFDPEPQVEQICGIGVDPAFDQIIAALGHIARPRPKPLIDSMMLWRKSKSDAANEARSQLQQSKATLPGPLQRRNTEPIQSASAAPNHDNPVASPGMSLAAKQEFVAHAERRSTVSIYILCRVLLEVIRQTTLPLLTVEMEEKLEGIIFGQLKVADTEQLMFSPLKLANWNLFAQLLGVMSGINFKSVADKFLTDIDRSLQELAAKSSIAPAGRDIEGKIELVLGGMKHLKLKLAPTEAWEQSCDFLVALGRLFNRSHGQKVKTAFCQVIDVLLLPIAAKASVQELSHPKWPEALAALGSRPAQMSLKPRHWSFAFPLAVTILCVSTPDSFSSQWMQLILPLQTKIKDRYTRPLCLQVISRLVWTYLYRTSDSPANAARKLDDVMKIVLPPTRRILVASDAAVVDPLLQIIRLIGFKYPEYCFKNIVFPLIHADLFMSNRESKVEQLDPDRIVVGIRAFMMIISDLEQGVQGRPPFPVSYAPNWNTERAPMSPTTVASPRNVPLLTPALPIFESEEQSRPFVTGLLSDGTREYYHRFCEVLGKITILCDNTFGGQAALDEKFSSPGPPKTPMTETFNFSRRDDHQTPNDSKQQFYELLHVAVQALPRCLSPDIPFNSLINLLCTGTAHVQGNIAQSSARSLKAIARQSHAQQVTTGFARFIFNFDDRYSTMSDGGMLGTGHIESTLRLYIELLRIWIEEIKQRTRDAAAEEGEASNMRGTKLDLSSVWAEVDQAEAHGLFFLCSQSRRVRYFAITVLRLIRDFDEALGKTKNEEKDGLRVIDVLENDSMQVMSFKDEHLSVAERSRLQRGMQNSNNRGALLELCTSDVSYDTTLWFKLFPNLIRITYEKCPFTVTIARDLICNRILQMYKSITVLSEPSRGLYYGSDSGGGRMSGRAPTAQPEVLIEQWKLYLIFACTTLTDTGTQITTPVQASQTPHGGRTSKSGSTETVVSARLLFKYLIPLLSASSASVREAVVLAMGSINMHIYRPLLEELAGQASRCNDEARARIHQRANSNPRRNRKMDLLRTEITHIYKLTSHFLKEPEVYKDEWILGNLVSYTRDLKLFLMDEEVQLDWEFQKLRRHYCGLMEELFEGINRTEDPSRWMSFESRKSAFSLMEDWCGFSPNQNQIRVREDTMRQSLISQQSHGERGTVTAAMEIEKRNLRTAALSAMAALCGGPMSITTESGATLQFDLRRLLAWIEAIFNSDSNRMNLIGRRALQNLIVHNREYPYLLEQGCIARCYLSEAPKLRESYFAVVSQVLLGYPDYPSPFWRLLSLCLFTLGNDSSEIRSKSARVLRALEERQQPARSSRIQDFDISISDKTKAVYKNAQFEISKRLAKQHTELAFHIFSEFTLYFKNLQPASQRNVVAIILPWIQSIELKVDPNGGPTAQSYVLLANLLEITIQSSAALHNEVQALWQALATGPYPGNVRLILDFIISLCLERREQSFVEYARQIVVFLASTTSAPGIKVVEFLLMQITPKAMVPNEKREVVPPPPDIVQLPYCADLSEARPIGTKQAGFSLGQLSLILLVDLMVSPVQLAPENVPLLLHVVAVLWDHYTPLVQEQAREMLVHLVHELVISRLDEQTPAAARKSIENLIDLIRRHDKSVVWGYEDNNGNGKAGGDNGSKGVDGDDHDNKVPASMEYLTSEVVKTFSMTYPGIKEQWGRLSLTWATSCPVRHLACRSFQIFRCVLTSLDQFMLGDMLARLSNTIADEDSEIQTFSMEILTTLKTLIIKLDAENLTDFPQLFWTTCACLESINELEFLEAVNMLDVFLSMLDFQSPSVRRLLSDGQPSRWEGPFDGLQALLYKGLRSSRCMESALGIINKVVQLPNDGLVGDDSRLFFAVLAHFPRLLHEMEQEMPGDKALHAAEILCAVAEARGYDSIAEVLGDYAALKYRGETGEFQGHLFSALRDSFLPRLEFNMIVFLMGLLTNSTPWVKIKTMSILSTVIPEVDMRRPELAGHGSDLISPLLRLLQTEYCMEALRVLDNIMTMSGSAMDKQHLRMSMTRSTSKTIRKEYERTQSLFGIPESSGWAIPMPAKKTDSTRANIHAAFYMCQNAEGTMADVSSTPDVEFHADDFTYGYFQMLPDRTDTMVSDEGRGNGGIMGDIVNKLDSLDDFFDDLGVSPPPSEGRSSRTVTEFSPDTYEPPFSREPSISNTMTPGAFQAAAAAAAAAAATTTTAPRPPLHTRSITSPSAPASYQPHISEFTSDDEYNTEDVFSDADDERPNADSGESSFSLESMIQPIAQSTRTRIRRLTGGRTREADRARELLRAERAAPPTPVPKLPANLFTSKQAQPPYSQGAML